MLEEAADTYRERNALYGDNYKFFGQLLLTLLGQIELRTPEDYTRMGLLVPIVSKITRYCQNWKEGGHDDSLMDMAVYATMLREIDAEYKRIAEEGVPF